VINANNILFLFVNMSNCCSIECIENDE